MRRSVICFSSNGARHPNGSNFSRYPRYDIVDRMRVLVKTELYDRPKWLTWVEENPPMELHNLRIQTNSLKNPYKPLIHFLLKKYPDLRFQDLYVDGNDYTYNNDTYRDDHPVMQFVSRQLRLMNQGVSREEAFRIVEKEFYARRKKLEEQQKENMILTLGTDLKVSPVFNTGQAYLLDQVAKKQTQALTRNILQIKSKIFHLEKKPVGRRQRPLERNEALVSEALQAHNALLGSTSDDLMSAMEFNVEKKKMRERKSAENKFSEALSEKKKKLDSVAIPDFDDLDDDIFKLISKQKKKKK